MSNIGFSWVIVVAWYLAAVAHVVWHLPVVKDMALEDFLVRGGLLIAMLTIASSNLATILHLDSIFRRPAFATAGVMVLAGFAILLWKYRRNRATAALQPNVGVLESNETEGE